MKQKPTLQHAQIQLLSAEDVATLLGISKRQVFRMKAAGLICPSVVVGRGSVRWKSSDVQQWIDWDCCSRQEFLDRRGHGNVS